MMIDDDDLAPENVEGDTLALKRWAGFDPEETRSGADQKIREDMVSPSPTSSFVYLEFFT